MRWGLFGTISYSSMDERFTASLGLRADANNYSSAMKSLSDQLSPRISLSYQLAEHWFVSGNAGLYYQLPPYTALGFKDNNGMYANKYNLRYMKSARKVWALVGAKEIRSKSPSKDSIKTMTKFRSPL